MRGKRVLVLVGFGVVAVAATAVVASGAYPTSGVTVYTGCLTTSGTSAGIIGNVAASPSTPTKACGKNQLLIHLSGGTITSVGAGTGLTGGGSDGAVSLALASGYKLPQGCASGQVAKVDGSGNWQCADDNNTTYSGKDFATSGQDCPAHQFATGIDANGALECAAPTLDDLQGSACTFDGHPSTLTVATDTTTGNVSMTCNPVYEVSVTVTGGPMSDISISDFSGPGFTRCTDASSCSLLLPAGAEADVSLTSGSTDDGGGSEYNITCPAGTTDAGTTAADPAPGLDSGTYYQSACQDAGGLTGDFAVTASFTS